MGRMRLNAITVIALVICILSACMVDSESLIPTAICAGSIVVLAITCLIRERLC